MSLLKPVVSIIFLAKGNYWLVKHCFDSIGFELKERKDEFIIPDAPKEYLKTVGDIIVELFVIDNTEDERISEYFNNLANNVTKKNTELAGVLNSAFRMATSEYICIIPTGIVLQPNWLIELVYNCANITSSGVSGIVSEFKNDEISSLLSTDGENLITVVAPADNLIKGLVFFKRELLYLVGAFDESPELTGNEIDQFALRCTAMSYYNYYLSTDTCIIVQDDDKIANSSKESGRIAMQKSLDEMRKARTYYLPLDIR